jgi:hypothetical protein
MTKTPDLLQIWFKIEENETTDSIGRMKDAE